MKPPAAKNNRRPHKKKRGRKDVSSLKGLCDLSVIKINGFFEQRVTEIKTK
jgi:hypothetical protein